MMAARGLSRPPGGCRSQDASMTSSHAGTPVRVGTAGWAVPRQVADRFPAEGSVLQRYAARFDAVEINTTFHRSHRPQTFARWAESVPDDFRFAVKVPKTITHERRLADSAGLIERFLDEVGPLGGKLGPLLVQLPPSLAFDREAAEALLQHLRARFAGQVAWEPRHPTWFADDAERLLADHRVARVAADPARVPAAALPGGWPGLLYVRLHGSPRIYYSDYDAAFLAEVAARLESSPAAERWCILDNTALGAAAGNALSLQQRRQGEGCGAGGGHCGLGRPVAIR
jgi:uncharacterized protein YecE (DUF72 family)